jgi:hypothetical protein
MPNALQKSCKFAASVSPGHKKIVSDWIVKDSNPSQEAKGELICVSDVLEKLGVEPRTFSTQHVLLDTMLRRCHTARPYPLTKSLLIDEEIRAAAVYQARQWTEREVKTIWTWFGSTSTWRCQLS